MKKSTLALAVAAILASPLAAQADTILYGSARVSVDYTDDDSTDGYWDVVNNDSRLGIQGSEDLGGGLSAVYQYEFGVDLTEGTSGFENNRPKFVGLKGGFGTLTFGTQETPYYHIAGIADTFNASKSYGLTGWLGGSFDGFSIGAVGDIALPVSYTGNRSGLTRSGNSIYYTTPEFNGFSAEAMLVMNGSETLISDSVDIWNVAAKYSNGPFFAGLSYIKLDGDRLVASLGGGNQASIDVDLDQWVVGLGYTAGPLNVGFIYERGTFNEWGLLKNYRVNDVKYFPGSDDAQNWYLTASYSFGNSTVRAAYGQLDTGISRCVNGCVYEDKIDNYLVGYQYNFSKRTLMWVEYIGQRADGNLIYADQDVISIGTRVDF